MNKALIIIASIASLLMITTAFWYWHEFYYPIKQTHACELPIPRAAQDTFDKLYQNKIPYAEHSYDFIENKHLDIFCPERGILKSRKYGWTVNLHYAVFLDYENSDFMLVSTGTYIDKYRLWLPPRFFYYVIRKKDGAIINKYAFDLNFVKNEIVDDVYYARIEDPNVSAQTYCMKVGE